MRLCGYAQRLRNIRGTIGAGTLVPESRNRRWQMGRMTQMLALAAMSGTLWPGMRADSASTGVGAAGVCPSEARLRLRSHGKTGATAVGARRRGVFMRGGYKLPGQLAWRYEVKVGGGSGSLTSKLTTYCGGSWVPDGRHQTLEKGPREQADAGAGGTLILLWQQRAALPSQRGTGGVDVYSSASLGYLPSELCRRSLLPGACGTPTSSVSGTS